MQRITSRVVTKIESKRLDDARFSVPADYDKTDLAPFVGGLRDLRERVPCESQGLARLFKKKT
jgi:hypothetical protein